MKILVLTCSTGGGHNTCAKYIKEEFNEYQIKCYVKNYLDIIDKKVSDLTSKLYLDSTKGNGIVFKKLYHLGEIYNKTNLTSPIYLLNKIAKTKLLKYIEKNKYTLIICTHLFPSMALTEIKKEKDIKFINVATDYECIPFWNETNPDLFIIPSKLLKKDFINKGINKKILLPIGIPVSSKFKNIKNNLCLPNDKDIVMITSGSMGFGKLKYIILKLLNNLNCYLLVICGNNKKLKEELLKIDNSNLIIKGFVNNMNEYMNKSKIIITKPGGLTTTEIAIMNKPIVHIMPIPGVENYNASFFANNKMSLKANNEDEIISKVELLLKNKNLCKKLINNQKKIINPNSAKDLVNYIQKHFK